MIMRYTDRTNQAFNNAYETAVSYNQDYLGTEHIIAGILAEGSGKAFEALEAQGVTAENFAEALNKVNNKEARDIEIPAVQPMEVMMGMLTPRTKRVLELAVVESRRHNVRAVDPEHILAGIIREGESTGYRMLTALGIELRILYLSLYVGVSDELTEDKDEDLANEDIGRMFNNMGRRAPRDSRDPRDPRLAQGAQRGQGGTPNLDKYGFDLTEAAKEGRLDPVIGRDEEVKRVMQILVRRTKNNPVLIGEAGVGKTAIAEGLAQMVESGEMPEALKDKKIISLDLTSMLAGAKYRGEFEERFEGVLNEAMGAGDVILFIDELHTIVGTGAGEGSLDAANILKPLLARGELQIIGATTIDEYRKIIEKDKALERRFQPVMVDEPTEEETYQILLGLKDKYEAHHGIRITDESMKASVELSTRYITDRFLPDKAIDLIDEASAKLRLDNFVEPVEIKEIEDKLEEIETKKQDAAEKEEFEIAAKLRSEELQLQEELASKRNSWKKSVDTEHNILTAEDIAGVVGDWTGIPVHKITESDAERLRDLENDLGKRVIGQEEAVEAVSRAIKRGRLGLKDPKRPTGSFIFLGTTGVGKTELAKALAVEMFGSEEALIRFDMSEYMEKFDVNKFIGSPPGYVGYDESGQLTEAVRRKPYSVILFDEIEKAHPDVLNILLQVLEDGRLTDGQGRTVDFKNSIVIMTSNIGAKTLTTSQGRRIGFGLTPDADTTAKGAPEDEKDLYGGRTYEEAKEVVTKELKDTLSPEFINRVDEIIFFRMLGKGSMEAIALNMLEDVTTRVENLGIHLSITEEAVALLANEGYDAEYGARPLRRKIQTEVEDRLGEAMLDNVVGEGDTAVVDVVDNELVITNSERSLQVVAAGDVSDASDAGDAGAGDGDSTDAGGGEISLN